jgi:hypothetical protein
MLEMFNAESVAVLGASGTKGKNRLRRDEIPFEIIMKVK